MLMTPAPAALSDVGGRCLNGLRGLIGRTPLLTLHLRVDGREVTVYAKAEHYNLTGSIKDRMALNVLCAARSRGELRPGALIAEATSGNAGIAIAAIGRALGHKVRIFMPDWMSDERKRLLRSLGAELELVSRADGGFLGAIAATRALAAADPDVFLPSQFSNEDNCAAHDRTTGPEILVQMEQLGARVDAFIAGVGTGGTVMGVGRALRSVNPSVRVHPLEPRESPTLSTGHKIGSHRIQGVSDDFIPAIVDLKSLNSVIAVADGDAILMAQRLARELGLGVGISSGANLLGALQVQRDLGPGTSVVTVFCDDNKKYLSTDLAREEPVRDDYLTPRVELLGFDALPMPAGAPH